jgi:hypothetical protein
MEKFELKSRRGMKRSRLEFRATFVQEICDVRVEADVELDEILLGKIEKRLKFLPWILRH